MATSPDISALAAYAGTYEQKLFSTLTNELDAIADVTVIPDVKNKLNMTKLVAGSGARPYSSTTQARGTDLQYTGRVLQVDQGKRDLEIEPYKYRPTWMSLAMKPGVNPDDIPFAPYVWAQVMKELAAEINDKTIYYGFDKTTAAVYSGATVYNPGDYITFTAADGIIDYWKCITLTTAGQSPTTTPAKWQQVNAEAITVGFGTRIAAELTAATITAVATGAISNTNAVAKFEQMLFAMPIAYRKAGFNMYCSFDLSDKYNQDYREKYKKYVEMNDTGVFTLDNTARRVTVIPCTWMGTSQRIIATPKENLLIGMDSVSDMNKVNTFPKLRTLEAGIDFAIGTQIRDLAALKVNDQA